MANVGVQASARREVLYTRPVRSLVRRVQMAKAARKCGELGYGNGVLHRALLGQVVESGRKRSRTLPRGACVRMCDRRGRERVAHEFLRPRTSAACWGTQGVSYTELSEV